MTLAERFRDAGYETAGYVASPHVAAQFGYDQGFNFYRDGLQRAGEVAALVSEFLESRTPGGRPLFLYVHLKEPHPPWKNGSPWLLDQETPSSFFDESCTYVPSSREVAELDESTKRDLIARYDGAILLADRFVGSVVDVLDRLGMLATTVIGVGTDHGFELLDRHAATHGYSPFEEVTRNFMLLWGSDGVPAGKRSSVQARNFDLGPTAMAAAGLDPPPKIDGLDLIGEPERLPETAFTFCYNSEVARRDDLKLITFHPRVRRRLPPGYDLGLNLFDLAADPLETRNVVAEHPREARDLTRALTDHLQRAVESARAASVSIGDERIDPKLLRQLEALGYLDD